MLCLLVGYILKNANADFFFFKVACPWASIAQNRNVSICSTNASLSRLSFKLLFTMLMFLMKSNKTYLLCNIFLLDTVWVCSFSFFNIIILRNNYLPPS